MSILDKVKNRNPGYRADMEAGWTRTHPGTGYFNDARNGVGDFAAGGSAEENAALAEHFSRLGRSRELAATTAASIDQGGDPWAANAAKTSARQGVANAQAEAFSNARLGSAQWRRQALLQLMSGQISWEQYQQVLQQQKDMAAGQNRNALYGEVGDLAGIGLGKLIHQR